MLLNALLYDEPHQALQTDLFQKRWVPMNEVQLVLLAQSGDRSAFDELLRNLYPSLLRYAGGLVGAAVADDIVQDAAMLVFRKLR